jgi:hypothetical protein
MLLETNVVGKETDWANYITLSDEHETPLLKRLPKGEKPVNVVKHYQADTYETPTPVAWPEGKAWDAFTSAGAQRKELVARVQYLVQTAAVGKLAQDVTNTAGVSDELAREITKKMTVIARQIECHAGSDQPAYADDGNTGHMFRGIGKWIQTTAQSDADADVSSTIRPASTQISTAATNAFTENILKGLLENMWSSTGQASRNLLLVGGWKAVNQIAEDFQWYLPSSTATTQASARVVNRNEGDMMLGSNISSYRSSWGTVELVPTKWNQFAGFSGGSATYNPYRTYLLHPDMWTWHWNQKPTVYQPEYKGGSYTCAIEAIIMLLCKNPIGEGAWKPAS